MFKKIGLVFILFMFLIFGVVPSFAKGNALKTPDETLILVDKYQAQYFEIIKRNDYFLSMEDYDTQKQDKRDLKKLYKTVKKEITNKDYLKKYKDIEKLHAKCDSESTVGINKCASEYYEDVDELLNEVYKEIKGKISKEDFNKLKLSERKWLKDVDAYEKVFNSMNFGTISTLIYYTYQIDMREFRTLLLMMYL